MIMLPEAVPSATDVQNQTLQLTETSDRPVGGLSPEKAIEAMMADVWVLAFDNEKKTRRIYKLSHYGQVWGSDIVNTNYQNYGRYCSYNFQLEFADIETFIEMMHTQKYIALSVNPDYVQKFKNRDYLDELIKEAEINIVGVHNEVNRHYEAALNATNRKKQLIKWFMAILKDRLAGKNVKVSMNKTLVAIIKKGVDTLKKLEES